MMKKLLSLMTLLLCVVVGVKGEIVELETTYNFKGQTADATPTLESTAHHKAANAQNVFLASDNVCNSKFAFQSVGNGTGFYYTTSQLVQFKGDRYFSMVDMKAGDKIVFTFSVQDSGSSTSKHFTIENAGTGSTTNLSLSEEGDAIAANTDMVSGTAYYVLEDGYVDFKTRKNFYLTKVVVTRKVDSSTLTEPTGTSVSPTSAYVVVGNTTTLTGSFSGGTFTGEWVSDNETVATVSDAGVVTGVSEGTAHITYQWVDDQSKDAYKATATITVVEAFDVNSLSVVKTYDFANWGSTTLTIESTKAGKIFNAGNSVNNDVFRCTNSGLESIAIQAVLSSSKGWSINDNGLYEGSGAGRCAAICDLKAGQYIEFRHNSGNSFYTKNNSEDDGARKVPLIEESNHHVYKVLEDGMVGFELTKGKYVTEVVIYEKETRIKTSLSFSAAEASATLGQAFDAPTLTKDPADLEGVVFSSSNTAVATVDANTGAVTLVAGGITTITATFEATETHTGSSASYELTVTDPNAEGYTDEGVTITWAFNTGATGQTANIVYATAEEALFKSNNVSIGSNLTYNGTQALNGTNDGLTSTKIKQNDAGSSTEQKNAIKFVVSPKAGMTFTPTSVRFLATRCGTDGGKMEIAWIDSENATVALGSAAASKSSDDPARDNNATLNATSYSYNLTAKGAKATTGECGLQIITYSANGKSYAFGQIVIEGTLSGQVSAVNTYTITAQVGTEGAGTVSPTESIVEEGDNLTLTATANTGYTFQNWTKASDGSWSSTTNPLTLSDIQADETYTANFKDLYDITYDLSSEGVKKGTIDNILQTEYASSSDKFTAPQNKYLTKDGFTFVKWTDGTKDYIPGTEYTLTSDITLQPVFVENTQSLTWSPALTEVTWNFRYSEVSLNIEGKTGYYVKQVQVNNETLDVVMAIDATSGKMNNLNRNDAWIQANSGTVLTIPALAGMTIVLTGYQKFSTTTIAGSTEYVATTASPFTATYTYTGSDATVDIVIGSDISYLSTVVVTYPRAHIPVDVTSVGYRTFTSDKALDFTNGVEGLTAYRAVVSDKTISFAPITGAVPAGEGMLLKANEGTYYIPVAAGTPAAIENAFEGVTSETVVDGAGIFVLMNGASGVGFYKTTAASFTVGANTAYLPADVATGRSFIGFDDFDDETTNINSLTPNPSPKGEGSIYTLSGQRVEKPVKGLYVKNGKKWMVK
jgi:uncharacterized protein YjdB